MDQSTGITKCAVLLVKARYLYESEVEEVCYTMSSPARNMKGADIINTINVTLLNIA